VAIGGLLGLRFLNKRKTNASKTSDLVLLLEPSSPQSKEDPTPGSEQPPKREEDQDEEEPVPVLAAGDQPKDEQVELIDHPPVLEEGDQSKDDLVDEEEQTPTSKEDEQPKDEQDEAKDPSPASDQQPPSDSGQLTYDSEGRPLDSNQLPPASEEGAGHTPGSNPQPELTPPSQQLVRASTMIQPTASSHACGLPPGYERYEKVRKFLENGFKYYNEVVMFLNVLRKELRCTSKILSQLIHACTIRTFVGRWGPYASYPSYIDETGPNMLHEGRSEERMREYLSTFLSCEVIFDEYKTVAKDISLYLDTKEKRYIFLDKLFREHEADDCDYNPISLDPLS
jgi:hypothetical protein